MIHKLKKKPITLTLLDQALVSGSNFLTTLIVAQLLGLHEFGIFATLWLILLFINTLHGSLVVFPMMTLIPKEPLLKTYFGSLLSIQIIFVFLASSAAFLISFFYFKYMDIDTSLNTILTFSLTILFYHMQDFYRRYFFATHLYLDALIIDTLSYFIRIIILLYLLIFSIKVTLLDIYNIFLFTFLIGVVYGIVKYKFSFNFTHLKTNYRDQWNLAKWLLPAGLMEWSSLNLFLVVASLLLGPIAIGAIRLGQNIILAFNVVLQGLENFLPTDATKVYISQEISGLNKFLLKVTSIGLISVIIFGIIITYFSKTIITLLYGENFLTYEYVVFWYAIILIFMFLFVILRIYLRTLNQLKVWFNAYIVTSVYALISVYPLISTFKTSGVLFGILSSYIVLLSTSFYMIRRPNTL
jgi:O-antigen/teichoic acid export membrane protein